jgi:hypothetical protein
MALLDPATVLKQLGALAPSENPYIFLDKLIKNFIKQPATVGITIVLSICAVAWLVSLICSILALRSKYKRGDRSLVRKQPSSFGTFYMCVLRARGASRLDARKASRDHGVAHSVDPARHH